MDIYFAVLNFTLSGAIGLIGLLTLTKVSTPREVVFASLPLLFALHQFTEGFVWLGVGGHIEPRALELAAGIFIYYAQGVLPFLVPLAIWLIEKDGYRKKLVGILTFLGLGLAVYTMYGLATVPSTVRVVNNTLFYNNPWTANIYDASIYVLTTCGALMLSSSIAVALFGVLNLIGLTIIYLLRPYGFTSLWCLYAAVISGLLYFHFVERRIKFLQDLKLKSAEFSDKLSSELDALNKKRLFTFKKA
ncbi:DUF6629 family protein [Sulfurimonas paralvinellae]|uniref:Uncharacterized protein n=1 Tax=Sulfurimonas paralvinellae TaxID=317658 RepID=A0A7M1BAC7_9BACT|nr:DUF6629 family protein [Sulfurimonas paralvinellae]QOP45788.1 hypothetical protein FM071_05600 [Sulfurimonas paralvinellae]